MAGRKKLENTAIIGFLVQVAFVIVCTFLAYRSSSLAVRAEAWHLTVGLVVWVLVFFHGRTRRLAEDEREERERLRATRLSEEIFEETELDAISARATLRFFEKYVVTIASILLAGAMLYLAYSMGRTVLFPDPQAEPAVVEKGMAAAVAVGMVFVAFVGFLIGKYAAGLAQSSGFWLLRAAAGYVMGNVMACLLIMVAMALYYFGVGWPEQVVAVAIPAVMALVALEILLNLLLDIYRPRVEGQERRPPYDSRFLGLFAEPGGVLKTVAATLDYQFGFRVSETWFYRFMERAIMPLVLVQLTSLWLLTCLVVVDQDEIVFIEQRGVPYLSEQDKAAGLKATVYEPGFYLKWPWPFAVARHVPAYRLHMVELGKVYKKMRLADLMAEKERDTGLLLWAERHVHPELGMEASFLVPGAAIEEDESEGKKGQKAGKGPEVNLAQAEVNLFYRVAHGEDGGIDKKSAYDYYYRQSDIEEHVDLLAYRALCRVAAHQDFKKWLTEGREAAARKLRAQVQETFDRNELGLEVTFVGITSLHPPLDTYKAFESVIAARQDKVKMEEEGRMREIELEYAAQSKSTKITSVAQQRAFKIWMGAAAEARLFKTQLKVCDRDGGERMRRLYMFRQLADALEEGLPGHKVYVVPVTPAEVDIIALEERLRTRIGEGLTVAGEQQ